MCTFVHMNGLVEDSGVSGTSARAGRQNDPGRKDRILAAALSVIVVRGVAGTTHRHVAEAAGVPVGSVTYYFRTLDDLIVQAFRLHVAQQRVAFEALFAHVTSRDELVAVLVDLVRSSRTRSRSAVLGFELHLAALRHQGLGTVTRGWTQDSRDVLAEFTDRETAARLDELVEGMILHELIAEGPATAVELRAAIERMLGPVQGE